MKKKVSIKALGIIAAIVGAGATLLSNWVDNKELDEKIDNKIEEALAEKEEDDDEDEEEEES